MSKPNKSSFAKQARETIGMLALICFAIYAAYSAGVIGFTLAVIMGILVGISNQLQTIISYADPDG